MKREGQNEEIGDKINRTWRDSEESLIPVSSFFPLDNYKTHPKGRLRDKSKTSICKKNCEEARK